MFEVETASSGAIDKPGDRRCSQRSGFRDGVLRRLRLVRTGTAAADCQGPAYREHEDEATIHGARASRRTSSALAAVTSAGCAPARNARSSASVASA